MLDCIIVGSGLAGSSLAFELEERGCKILVIDDPTLSSSTRIAAGLYNPIVFKKLNKIWRAEILLPIANEFYKNLEVKTGKKFWHSRCLARIFSSFGEQNDWQAEIGNGNPFLEEQPLLNGKEGNDIEAPFGYGSVNNTGNLDTLSFLAAAEEFLGERKLFLREKFIYDNLEKTESGWKYKEYFARQIVFCEGWKMRENPYFNFLPFEPVKGEVLTVSVPGLDVSCTINGSCFLLPLGNDLYRVGATFRWDTLDEIPTEEGKREITEKLKHFLKSEFTITDHKAAVRPATSDRRPIIGEHPNHNGMYILNGMGTRGVLNAPWSVIHLAEQMLEGVAADPETDVKRFKKK